MITLQCFKTVFYFYIQSGSSNQFQPITFRPTYDQIAELYLTLSFDKLQNSKSEMMMSQ